MLKSPERTGKISVCLLASHPLVLADFERHLGHLQVRVHRNSVCPDGEAIPRATLYVIDFEGNLIATERMVAKILEQSPGARMLLVGREFDDRVAFPLLRMGIKGLLLHSQLADDLERAMQSIAAGGYWVPRTLLSRFVDSVLKKALRGANVSSRAGLSRREKEVTQGLLDNLSNKEIGNKLNISERTVKFHVSNLLQKFNVRRRADLIVLAFQDESQSPAASLTTLEASDLLP
jgi:two-component system, NarL family, nitrate/nitrite response regulator NarL